MEEIWKPIIDFKDKYEISNLGRIRNIRTNKILKMTNKYGNYFSIRLYDETHKRSTRIHREVAKAFIPNPNNLPEVNHKDTNKQNNKLENLEWVTKKENIQHAIKNGKFYFVGHKNKNKISKNGKIYQFTIDMKFVNKYNNSEDASRNTGVCSRNILHCVNHKEGRKQAGGYKWFYESEVVKNGNKL